MFSSHVYRNFDAAVFGVCLIPEVYGAVLISMRWIDVLRVSGNWLTEKIVEISVNFPGKLDIFCGGELEDLDSTLFFC